MNGKKARALRKYSRARLIERCQNMGPSEVEEVKANWGRRLYQAAKKVYKKIPKDRKRNG